MTRAEREAEARVLESDLAEARTALAMARSLRHLLHLARGLCETQRARDAFDDALGALEDEVIKRFEGLEKRLQAELTETAP